LDLGALKSIIDDFTDEGPRVLTGGVEMALERQAEKAFEATVSFTEDIAFAMDIEDETIEVNLERATPLAAINMDFDAETMSGEIDMGVADIKLPMNVLFDSEDCEFDESIGEEVCTPNDLPEGAMAIHLGGVNGQLLFDAASELVTLTGAGLGNETTTVHVGDDQILSIDVNAEAGRTFDATFGATDEAISISLSPALQVAVAFDMARAGLDVPDFFLDEDLGIIFEGANPTLTFADDKVQVSGGTLELTSSSHDDVIIEDGMCIGSIEEGEGEEGDDHPFSSLVGEVCQ
jgi:hypothetical protein